MKKSEIKLGHTYLAYGDVLVVAQEFDNSNTISCQVLGTIGGGDSPYYEKRGQWITVPLGKITVAPESTIERQKTWAEATEFAVGLGFKVALHAQGAPTIYLDEANVTNLRDLVTVKATVAGTQPRHRPEIPPHHIPSGIEDAPDQKDLML